MLFITFWGEEYVFFEVIPAKLKFCKSLYVTMFGFICYYI